MTEALETACEKGHASCVRALLHGAPADAMSTDWSSCCLSPEPADDAGPSALISPMLSAQRQSGDVAVGEKRRPRQVQFLLGELTLLHA